MLGKLIKYDFKALAKNMFPIYALMIALTFACSLMIRFNLERSFVFGIAMFAWVVSMSSSFAITIWMTVMRFYHGLLKNEGYLSFALPAVVEVIALGICALIFAFTVAPLRDLMEAFKYFFTIDADFYLMLLQMALLGALELLAGDCLFFAAFSIAHLFDRHQKLIAGVFVVLMFILRGFLFPSRFSMEFGPGSEFVLLHPLLFIIPLVLTIVYSLVTWYILDKKLNLQ